MNTKSRSGFSILVLALVLRNGWRAVAEQPAVWLWAYLALAQAVILAQDRYHIPSIPAIAMLAGYTLVYGYDTWLARPGVPADGARGNAPYVVSSPEVAERAEV